MMQLSSAALEEIRRWQGKLGHETAVLRLMVQPGGCLGQVYQLGFSPSVRPDDEIYQFKGVQIAVAHQSLAWVQDLVVDYSEDLMGGGFQFRNPQIKQTCSCGYSFNPDVLSHEV